MKPSFYPYIRFTSSLSLNVPLVYRLHDLFFVYGFKFLSRSRIASTVLRGFNLSTSLKSRWVRNDTRNRVFTGSESLILREKGYLVLTSRVSALKQGSFLNGQLSTQLIVL